MVSFMEKLRDAQPTTSNAAVVQDCLEAFLDRFQGRSVWTETMVPTGRRGAFGNNDPYCLRIIKGPDKTKVAQGVHVHYALVPRLVMFRNDTFRNFLMAHNPSLNGNRIVKTLKTTFGATTYTGVMLKGTHYKHAIKSMFFMVPVPAGSLLERRMFGENSPAVEDAMRVFEDDLERRRLREELRRRR